MRPRPICGECKREMDCVKNDFPVKNEPIAGFEHYETNLWLGDRYACPACGKSIVIGFGLPIRASKQPELEKEAMSFRRF